MTRVLQRKFVMTAMTAVTVLLLLLLGVINFMNIWSVRTEVDRTLHLIFENEGNERRILPEPAPEPASEPVPPGFLMREPKNDYDTLLSSNFFVIRFDTDGNVVYVDVSRTSSVDEEQVTEIADQIYSGRKAEGKIGKFRYLMQADAKGNGVSLIGLDTSKETFSVFRILFLSGVMGLLCWGLMLILVMLLSKRAIRPIAENIEKQKQFVTNAGHEIKTPLAIIQSNAEALELYQGESKWSKNIKAQTERLSKLMKDLLLLARMDEGALPSERTRFSLSDMLSEAVQEFRQPLETRQILLQTEIAEGIFLYADPAQIEKLLFILLDNAVKYTGISLRTGESSVPGISGASGAEDAERADFIGRECPEVEKAEDIRFSAEKMKQAGEVKVVLKRHDKKIEIRIQNTCENLPDAAPEKLFDRFYRNDAARTQKKGGYGIGLSMARSIAAANKGTIHAEYLGADQICFIVGFSVS